MSDRDKPELTFDGPNPPDVTDVTCPSCDATYDRRIDLDTEREELSGYTDRTDYWCPNCEEHIGTRTDYHGPVPVEIGPGIYELQ